LFINKNLSISDLYLLHQVHHFIHELPDPMPRKKKQKKIFVLDTSVILYNHNAIMSFEENDVAIPITVLEELDNFKKGNETKNFEAREFIRIMDKLSEDGLLTDWIPLNGKSKGKMIVVMNAVPKNLDATKVFGDNKADHKILNAALLLKEQYPEHRVIMVTKDVNLRLKAKSLNLLAEDFQTGKIQNVEELYTGMKLIENLDSEVIVKIYDEGFVSPADIGLEDPIANQYFILRNGKSSALAFYNPITKLIERVEKRTSLRIRPRNAEQVFALHALLNPDVKLVTLQGVAGTGKTLLAFYSEAFPHEATAIWEARILTQKIQINHKPATAHQILKSAWITQHTRENIVEPKVNTAICWVR